MTCVALLVLRSRGVVGRYRTFGYPLTPILFIYVSAWIAYAQIKAHPAESGIVGLVLVAGALAYTFAGVAPKRD